MIRMRRSLIRLAVLLLALLAVLMPSITTAQPPNYICNIAYAQCILWSCPWGGWPPDPLAVVFYICCPPGGPPESCFLWSSVVGCC